MSPLPSVACALLVATLVVACGARPDDGPAPADASHTAEPDGDALPIAASAATPLPPATARSPRNILLISVDTLRPDHMSLYGYARSTTPRLDAFFADAEVYERAYSAEANTPPSVVTMLSGLLPARHRVRAFFQRLRPEVHLLSDRLSAAGYQTAAVVSNFVLTTEATGLSTRFDHYDDFVTERELHRAVYERRASRTTDAALAWLAGGRDPERPHLLWVHYIDPHAPYRVPDDAASPRYRHGGSGVRPVDLTKVPPEARLPGVTDARDYVDRYDEEVAYADAEIGRLLAQYDALGLADEAIVVFTADHGEALAEHEIHYAHGYAVWEPIMRVPLALRRPDAPARRIATPVSLADVTPTLLSEIGLPGADGLDGVALHDRAPDDRLSLEATGWDGVHRRAIVQGDDKWTAAARPDRIVFGQRSTNLALDPNEQRLRRSTPGENPALLEAWFRDDPDPGGRPASLGGGVRLDGPKVAPGRSAHELEALRALGYVVDDADRPPTTTEPSPRSAAPAAP